MQFTFAIENSPPIDPDAWLLGVTYNFNSVYEKIYDKYFPSFINCNEFNLVICDEFPRNCATLSSIVDFNYAYYLYYFYLDEISIKWHTNYDFRNDGNDRFVSIPGINFQGFDSKNADGYYYIPDTTPNFNALFFYFIGKTKYCFSSGSFEINLNDVENDYTFQLLQYVTEEFNKKYNDYKNEVEKIKKDEWTDLDSDTMDEITKISIDTNKSFWELFCESTFPTLTYFSDDLPIRLWYWQI